MVDEKSVVVDSGIGQDSNETASKIKSEADIVIPIGNLYKFDKGMSFCVDGVTVQAESEFVGEVVEIDGSIITLAVNNQKITMAAGEVINKGVQVEKKIVKLSDAQRTFLMLHEAATMFISTFNQAMMIDNVSREERKQAVRDFLKTGKIDNKFADKMVSIIEYTLGTKQQKEVENVGPSEKSEKA